MSPTLNKPNIIGLSGPAGCGKDTVADLLVTHAGFHKISFADALRAEVANAFLIDQVFLTQRETKEQPMRCLALSRCLDQNFVIKMVSAREQIEPLFDIDAPRSPRQIMQWWGTDYRRHQQADYWVSKAASRIKWFHQRQGFSSRVVVTDCRFADEAAMVRELGGQVWQIKRDGTHVMPGAHVSEVSGAEFQPDVILNNNHTVKHLCECALEAYWTSFTGMAPGSLKVRIDAPKEAA